MGNGNMNKSDIWPRSKTVRYWILALFFMIGAIAKFAPAYSAEFVDLGWPGWFRFVVGGIELLCAALLVIPTRRARFWAAGALVLVLTGAVTNQAVMHIPLEERLMAPLFLIVLMVVAASNWPSDWRDLFRAPRAGAGDPGGGGSRKSPQFV
ncbi:DoxX family protein [Nocardia gipuzkoensis]